MTGRLSFAVVAKARKTALDAERPTESAETIVDPLGELVARANRDDVPRDGVAHIHEDLAAAALEMMERNMGAEITSCAAV